MSKVLITGATGTTGSRVAAFLSERGVSTPTGNAHTQGKRAASLTITAPRRDTHPGDTRSCPPLQAVTSTSPSSRKRQPVLWQPPQM